MFIDRMAKDGKSTYVHCKAGRTRSATVALCYMMFKNDYSPENALESIRRARQQVILRTNHWNSINDYRRFLDEQRNKPTE
jgi:atypical dual specificity phosphatase